MNRLQIRETALLMSSACAASALMAGTAYAQGANESTGLEDIVVTAQKREQSVQDVPIAVTALSADTLQANRVTNVGDLSGLAPGFTVRPAAGGSAIPSFSMRGAVSYGVVPGSDKEVSVYLDGVYISSPRGSIFDLPDVQRIEVLRGPQGTLFGRNATAGAVSVTTRDPSGEVGVKATATYGNQDEFRFGIGVDLPQVGPFSAYLSYIHNYRRGDIRNANAGMIWNRTASAYAPIAKVNRSPEWLGTRDSDTFFGALKFESGDFTTVYKYDRTQDDGTPEGTGAAGIDPAFPGVGAVLRALTTTQPFPVYFAADGKRPDIVNNGWAIPKRLRVEGHSLTSTYQVSDSFSVKNIAAYRKSEIFSASALDGFSALPLTPQAALAYAPIVAASTVPGFATLPAVNQGAIVQAVASGLVGLPFVALATAAQSRSKQWSDELQFNYTSDFLTATVGAMYFHSQDYSAEHLFQNTPQFSPFPGGVIPQRSAGRGSNKATSLAAYAQLEFHVTPQLDLVLGGRVTDDKKSGTFDYGTPPALKHTAFSYHKTKPNYLVGVNYKPTDDLLLYGKFSTAFVSGGTVSVITFEPETATSFEAGIKAEVLDRRLRANLAVYQVTYKHVQSAQSATNFTSQITTLTGDPALAGSLGTLVVDAGTIKAKGFELDLTAAPVRGLTLGGSLGYTNTKFSDVPAFLLSANGGAYLPSLRPDWTGSLYSQFDTKPFGAGEAYLSFRGDAIYQSRMSLSQNSALPEYSTFLRNYAYVPAYWVFNGRVAVKEMNLGGVNTELALWGRNLTDRKYASFALDLKFAGGANYIPARSYGADLTIKF
ncbi:TonB-dependent receptor [Novosphingobium sp. G106]|uniref:TonB-dependent receptor n=1 Tax=Novosphingobium sp. G106 TaxID=2849500 RepID=UPI001C2DB2C0|nr:TonB-dependent receptor [Novosphingobium sp. G106]MBV1687828.1 TonB-dependent receptor [Novosphingobium sp. G106]